jgi:hypothetical protein
MNIVESCQIVWRSKKTRGPDVEMALPLPITVAIESKRTVADAYDKIGQLIDYVLSERYDAVFLRLEKPPRQGDENFRKLENAVSDYGIGILVGESPYSPLTESQSVLRKASLHLCSDPLELIRGMGLSAQSLKMPFDRILSFRKYFLE